MTPRALAAAVVALAGCGRIGFEASSAITNGDAPSHDGQDGQAARCTGAELLCDGFETEAAGFDARWQFDTFHGSAVVDTTKPHRGALSAHFTVNAITTSVNNPRATILSYQGLPYTGTLYARVWMFFPSGLPMSPFAQMVNFANSPGQGISTGVDGGFLVDNDYTTGGYAQSTTTQLPLDAWTCLQMTMPSGTTDTIRIFVDGAEVTDIALPKSSPQPQPDHVYLGIEWVNNVTNHNLYEAWLDDVVIDSKPTTCDQ